MDATLFKHALREHDLVSIHVVEDGQQALDFLRRVVGGVDAPRPDLILLDLSIPRRSGHEVLKVVKTEPDLRSIPVIMFTSSTSQEDVRRAYDAHVNCYVAKPVDQDEWAHVVAVIEMFWFQTATLPGPVSRKSVAAGEAQEAARKMRELEAAAARSRQELLQADLSLSLMFATQGSTEIMLGRAEEAKKAWGCAEKCYRAIRTLFSDVESEVQRDEWRIKISALRDRLDSLQSRLMLSA